MLKVYEVNGMTYQYEEGEQPEGAVEVKAVKPKNKAATVKNKAAKPEVKKG